MIFYFLNQSINLINTYILNVPSKFRHHNISMYSKKNSIIFEISVITLLAFLKISRTMYK